MDASEYVETKSSSFDYTDIDECVEKPFICGPNSTCTNSQGSYKCACDAGFQSSNGANCTGR